MPNQENLKSSRASQLCGVGLVVRQSDEGCLVTGVHPNGSASNSGSVFVGDRVHSVDGLDAGSADITVIRRKLLGEPGSFLSVVVSSPPDHFENDGSMPRAADMDSQPRTVTLERKPIVRSNMPKPLTPQKSLPNARVEPDVIASVIADNGKTQNPATGMQPEIMESVALMDREAFHKEVDEHLEVPSVHPTTNGDAFSSGTSGPEIMLPVESLAENQFQHALFTDARQSDAPAQEMTTFQPVEKRSQPNLGSRIDKTDNQHSNVAGGERIVHLSRANAYETNVEDIPDEAFTVIPFMDTIHSIVHGVARQCTLTVEADGCILLTPPPKHCTGERGADVARLGSFGNSTHIQNLREIVQVSESSVNDLVTNMPYIGESLKPDTTPLCRLRIIFRDDSIFDFSAFEPKKILSCVKTHQQRQNSRRVSMARSLLRLSALASTKFDESSIEHRAELADLWIHVFGDRHGEFSANSNAWESIGFQSPRPSIDFRGMGLLGLRCILYFAMHRQAVAEVILQEGRTYPFALTIINIAHRIANATGLSMMSRFAPTCDLPDDPPLLSLMTRLRERGAFADDMDGVDAKKPTPLPNSFFEIMCVTMELFDFMWTARHAQLPQFDSILSHTISTILAASRGPITTLGALRRNIRSISAADPYIADLVGAGAEIAL